MLNSRKLGRKSLKVLVVFIKCVYGKTVEVVSEEDGACSGRTSEYLHCRASGQAPRKSLVNVFVTKVHHDGSLEGIVR